MDVLEGEYINLNERERELSIRIDNLDNCSNHCLLNLEYKSNNSQFKRIYYEIVYEDIREDNDIVIFKYKRVNNLTKFEYDILKNKKINK